MQDIKNDTWKDWKWQLRNRITTTEGLQEILKLTYDEIFGIQKSDKRLPMAITPYFASLMDKDDPACPIRRQVVPNSCEFQITKYDLEDPLGEDVHTPVPGLIHRYPDRVLVITTYQCAAYCRYCTRERLVGSSESFISEESLEKICKYINDDKNIRDVILSGGDPLLLDTKKLEYVLARLKQIDHLDIIRIGTKIPVTLPFRIDQELVSMLKKYQPIYLSIHFTHPKEITPEVKQACARFSDAGVPLGSQTVLLKGINDSVDCLKTLFHELLKMRVRPYYLYQCDLARGTEHFRTPVADGIQIMDKLQGYTSGYAIPSFVIDAPGGGGKVPISPRYVIAEEDGKVMFRNYENKIYEYEDVTTIVGHAPAGG